MSSKTRAPTASGPSVKSSTVAPLLSQIEASLTTLEALTAHRARLGDAAVGAIVEVVHDIRRRLARSQLHVCVVGEKKAGKSTFLNAMLGQRVLGAAVRECTGTVTFLRHGPQPQYRASLTSGCSMDFNDNFPDRTDYYAAAIKEAEDALQKCSDSRSAIPVQIGASIKQMHADSAALVEVKARRAECEAAEKAVEAEIGIAEAALASFTERLRKAGVDIPWFYKNLAHWWKPWVSVPRLIAMPFAKQPWKEHLEQVRLHYKDQLALKALKEKVCLAKVATEERDQEIKAQTETLIAARNRIIALQQQYDALPATIAQWRARLQELPAERDDYARRRLARFHEDVRQLTDMQQQGGDVEQLELTYPGPLLPRGLVIIDTPGVNTDNKRNLDRAWEVIRREADGCILLTDIQQAISGTTRQFIEEVRKYVPHLLLILTKTDRALESAAIGDESAEAQIEEARRTAVKRFAATVGRHPRELLSIAIAAEPALRRRDRVAVSRFAESIRRLVAVLRQERALVVAARCATAIRQCRSTIAEAHERAEAAYRQRIADLEAQQIGAPDPFCREALAAVARDIHKTAATATALGKRELHVGMKETVDAAVQLVLSCQNPDALKHVGAPIDKLVRNLQSRVDRAVSQSASENTKALDSHLLSALQERYRIVQRLVGRAERTIERHSITGYAISTGGFDAGLQSSASEYKFTKGVGVFGGAATGAIVGSFVPVIGTVIGGLVGGMIGALFGPSFDSVKRDCAAKIATALQDQEGKMLAQLDQGDDVLAREVYNALNASLQAEVKRFRTWIHDVIEEEQQRLARERQQLSHLIEIRNALNTHDARLQQLMQAAADESFGICRDTGETA